ncbi:sortase A [Marmoricola sp. OAE513]|uniref:class E sortase n=1 Tax=Marmoricola sp. OAE513 TaxID=2817894 RepID=UPI001AE4EAAE
MTPPTSPPTPPSSPKGGARVKTAGPVEIRPGEATEVVAMVSSVCTMLALISVWFLLQVLVLSGFSQARDQHILYGQFRTQVAEATAPLGPVITPGKPVAVLTIPKLDVQQVVVEGTASGDMQAGPGHRRDSVIPGQVGTSYVYGRSATYGKPFADLDTLKVGDKIVTQTGQAKTTFVVEGIRRAGDQVTAPEAGAARLTLVTAEGTGFLHQLRPSDAVYVDAVSETGQQVPSGRPVGVPKSELAMEGTPGALPMLALGLALLTGLTIAVIAARQRWSAPLVWVIASPLAIALSWFTTDQVVRLLPNLM